MAKTVKKKKDVVEDSEPKKKKPTLFDVIGYLTHNKKKWNDLTIEEQKVFNPYMVNRFLSMDLYLIEALNDLQKYTLNCLEKQDVYNLFYHLLPDDKLYLKYIKPQIEIPERELELLVRYFKVSERECEDYWVILNKSDEGKEFIKKLISSYQYEDK